MRGISIRIHTLSHEAPMDDPIPIDVRGCWALDLALGEK
jgi:hypothetical protein